MIYFMVYKGYKFLYWIHDRILSTPLSQEWLSADDMGFAHVNKAYQESSIKLVKKLSFKLGDDEDSLIWSKNDYGGFYTPKIRYQILREEELSLSVRWYKVVWNLKCPLKTKLFFCLTLVWKVLVQDNLLRKFGEGPSRCPLCKLEGESINHLFISCPYMQVMWCYVSLVINIQFSWKGDDFMEAF